MNVGRDLGREASSSSSTLKRYFVSQQRLLVGSVEPVERTSSSVDDGKNEHLVFEVLVADGVEAEAREKVALDRRLDVAGTRPCRPNVRALGDGGQSSIDFGEELVTQTGGALVVPVSGLDDIRLRVRV